MHLEWDPKIGPSAIIGIAGSLAVMVTIGIVWGSTVTRLDNVTQRVTNVEMVAKDQKNEASESTSRIASQAERLAKIEAAVTFIVPALQEIGRKIDGIAQKH